MPARATYMKAIPPGWSLVANQCANENTVSTLMPAVPYGTLLLKFNNKLTKYEPLNSFNTSWSDPLQLLAPGEGAWIFNPTAAAFAITIPGTPNAPSLPSPFCFCNDCYLVSHQAAVGFATYAAILGCPPVAGSTVHKFDPVTQTFVTATFLFGAWAPVELTAAVGEALWICPSGGPAPPVPTLCSYTINVPSGYSLIANQCKNAKTVASLMPSAAFGTRLLKYNNVSGSFEPWNAFSGAWSNPSQTLAPGEGAWIFNPNPAPFRMLMLGEVNTPRLPLPYCNGSSCYLVSRQTATAGNYADIMGCPPRDQTTVYKFRPATQGYSIATYSAADGFWDPAELTADVGEALWICPRGGSFGALPSQCMYTKKIPPAWSLVANQCGNANTVSSLMPSVPFGTLLLKYNNAGGNFAPLNAFRTNWSNPSQTLAPGEGAWIFNPNTAPFNIFIAGTNNTPTLPLPYCAGASCYLVSRQTAAAGNYEDNMGCPPVVGSKVYKFDPATQTFLPPATFTAAGWDQPELTAEVGESLWICAPGGPAPKVPDVCSGYPVSVPPGFRLIANQCLNANTVSTLIPHAPIGAKLIKYENTTSSFSPINTFTPAGWNFPNQTLAPGEGAWIFNPNPAPFRMLMVGAVNTPTLPLPYCGGSSCYLVSRQTAALGNYADIMGCAPVVGSKVYKFDPATQTFLAATFNGAIWDRPELTAEVGESLWICPTGAAPPAIPCWLTGTLNCLNASITISWPCAGCHLEQTGALADPVSATVWAAVAGNSPRTLQTMGAAKFFRVVCP